MKNRQKDIISIQFSNFKKLHILTEFFIKIRDYISNIPVIVVSLHLKKLIVGFNSQSIGHVTLKYYKSYTSDLKFTLKNIEVR